MIFPSLSKKAVVGHPPMLYRRLTSGLLSVSTRIGTNFLFSASTIDGSEYDVSSMTWHQWHQDPLISSRIGLPSARAFSKLSLVQSSHWIFPKLSLSNWVVENDIRVAFGSLSVIACYGSDGDSCLSIDARSLSRFLSIGTAKSVAHRQS